LIAMNEVSRASPVRRFVWAAVCGALFFAAYGSCTAHTAALADVPTAFVAWDYRVPFIPWTIVPYWSLDVLFITAFMIQRDRVALSAHTTRVVVGIFVACAGFLLFPLRADVGMLPDAGLWQPWFSALRLFDKPFNQAPSLHIILLLIVWRAHLPAVAPRWRPVAYAWGALIALSTVTTRQHGLIDVFAGAVVGTVIVNLIRPEPVFAREGPATPRMAWRYGCGAVVALVGAVVLAPHSLVGAWAALWLAVAAALVAGAYFSGSPKIYAKQNGRVHWAAFLMLAPVLIPQRLAHRWLSRDGGCFELAPDVTFGPIRGKRPAGAALVDLTAEHASRCHPKTGYACVPMTDLAAFCPERVAHAADEVERLRQSGPVHIVCALGLSRSATVAAAWLMRTGRASTTADAVLAVRLARADALPEISP
jgi:hypothetical protein